VQGTVSGKPSGGPLVPALFLPDLDALSHKEALREIVAAARAAGAVEAPEEALRILLDREILGTTAVGKGVAIPHGRSMVVPRPYLAFARSLRGVPWQAPDDEDVHLIFLLLAPDTPPWRGPYLEHLARLAAVGALIGNRKRLLSAPDLATVRAILAG
jgi:mannitol/fructose-specific phosphotransferase system IIA component (Ntr-type)